MLRIRLFSALAVCAAALASTSIAPAQAPAQAKIAVVNFQKALLDTEEAKKANNDLIAEFKPQQDELEKIQRNLQDDQTKLQNSQGKLSPQGEAERAPIFSMSSTWRSGCSRIFRTTPTSGGMRLCSAWARA